MKDVEFAKRWRRQVSETVVEEYSAGSKVTVSEAIAKEAATAGVLKGEPVDTPAADKPAADTPPADKPAAESKTQA